MSRKENCLDNSPTENFFKRMKEEMFYGKEYLYSDMDKLIKGLTQVSLINDGPLTIILEKENV